MIEMDSYKQTIRELSDRLVEAQRPIRILDAIKWDAEVQEDFFNNKFKKLPKVDRAYYEARPLDFDPVEYRRLFQELSHDIQRMLGQFNPVGVIMRRMCREYEMVIRLLEARGTPEFTRISRELFGSATDAFHAGDPNLTDLGILIAEALDNIDASTLLQSEEKNIPSEEVVVILQERLNIFFPDTETPVIVKQSDGIVADAAAGADYLKIRSDIHFTRQDIRLLEIHEGWVHLGTTLNGMRQPVCTFLSKGPPSSTITQEGLAMLMELIAFASYPARLRRLTNRVRGVAMAESGANFLDVFHFFREQSFSEQESYINTARIYRGSTPDGGPFTKDISYTKGFILVYNFIQLAVRRGLVDRVPLLFCGKTNLEDMRTLSHLVEEGLVVLPKYLPPQFADMSALAAWMCYSNFLNQLNLQRIEADYANIL